MPAGYYEVPGMPYPRRSAKPDERDLLATAIADEETAKSGMAMDAGIGAQPPRDPYFANLPPRQPAAQAPTVRQLQPDRKTAFSRADAQALAALDPRALDEANRLAAMPESTPAKITGSFNGQAFEMQPAARVDRNALARLYAQAQERKAQERQDAVRGQEQAGKERIVTIPGEQATQREKIRAEAAAAEAAAARAAAKPEQAARVAASQAQTEAARAKAQREQQEFAERITPEQQALDEAIAAAKASPFAATAEGRARIRELEKRSTAGRQLPPEQAAALGESTLPQQPDAGAIAAEVMADPGIAALIARAKETEPGLFTGSRGRQTSAAARQLAERAIRARIARSGGTPEDADALITSILGPGVDTARRSVGALESFATNSVGPGGMAVNAIKSAFR